MGMHSSRHGKFIKKDPDHGRLWKKIRNWWCGAGLCNMNTCSNDEHDKRSNIPNNCKDPNCVCKCGKKGKK